MNMAVVLKKTLMPPITSKNVYLESIKGKQFATSATKKRSAYKIPVYESSNNKNPQVQYFTNLAQLKIKNLPVPVPMVTKKPRHRARKPLRSSSCPNLVTRKVKNNPNNLLKTKSSEELSHKQTNFLQSFFHSQSSALVNPHYLSQSKQGDYSEGESFLHQNRCESVNSNQIQVTVINQSKQQGLYNELIGPKYLPIGVCACCSKCFYKSCKPTGPRASRCCKNYRSRYNCRTCSSCCKGSFDDRSEKGESLLQYYSGISVNSNSGLIPVFYESEQIGAYCVNPIQVPVVSESKPLGAYCVPVGPTCLPINPCTACCGCCKCPSGPCKPCGPCGSCCCNCGPCRCGCCNPCGTCCRGPCAPCKPCCSCGCYPYCGCYGNCFPWCGCPCGCRYNVLCRICGPCGPCRPCQGPYCGPYGRLYFGCCSPCGCCCGPYCYSCRPYRYGFDTCYFCCRPFRCGCCDNCYYCCGPAYCGAGPCKYCCGRYSCPCEPCSCCCGPCGYCFGPCRYGCRPCYCGKTPCACRCGPCCGPCKLCPC